MIILTVPIPVIRVIITMTSIIASTTDSHLPFTCGRGRSRPWTALSADPPASWVDGCCHTWTWAWWPRPGLPSAGWPMLQVLTWRLTHTFPLDISVSLLRCGARLFTTNERNIYVFHPLVDMKRHIYTIISLTFPIRYLTLPYAILAKTFLYVLTAIPIRSHIHYHAKLHKRGSWQRCHPELLPPCYCATPQATISSFDVFKPFLFRHASVLW